MCCSYEVSAPLGGISEHEEDAADDTKEADEGEDHARALVA